MFEKDGLGHDQRRMRVAVAAMVKAADTATGALRADEGVASIAT
jgi:hypothetical protein